MPRRRADKVIEHRISLSDGLHKEVKEVIKTNKQLSQIGMVGNGAKAALNVAAVGGVLGVAYLGVKAYAEAKGIAGSIKSSLEEAWDWSFGVKTNADGSIVPTTVNAVDADGNPIVVTNPVYKIPILNRVPGVGGLFDWGMQLGATNNPFADNPEAAAVVDKLTQFEWERENGAYDSYVNPEYDAKAAAAEKARIQKIKEDRFKETLQDAVEEAMNDPENDLGGFDDIGEDLTMMPDDWQGKMTAWEWALWTTAKRNYTDLGRQITWEMSYSQYVTWYNKIDFTGLRN